MTSPLAFPTLLPTLRDRFVFLDQLGEGEFSQVFRAKDASSGQLVAIKQLRGNLRAGQKAFGQALFKRETALLANLSHPGLPAVIEHTHEALVMEYIAGNTLRYLIHTRSLRLVEVLRVGIDLCTILDYLHSQDPPIIHRDLHPANVIGRSDGSIVLLDFGIARRFREPIVSHWRYSPGQKTYDTFGNLGTIGYAAPEQYGETARTTPRSDLFSLGVMLHQMLTGEDPTIQAKRKGLVTLFQFSSLGHTTPPRLANLIADLVKVDPAHRPARAASVRQVLTNILLDLAEVPGNSDPLQVLGLSSSMC